MSYLINPPNYKSILNLQQTELGIQKIKDFFSEYQKELTRNLPLYPSLELLLVDFAVI